MINCPPPRHSGTNNERHCKPETRSEPRTMDFPEELHYTASHEWIRVDGNVATVGITAYAVEQLSDLVFIELPESGTTVEREQPFGEIESTKTVSELYAPVGGTIVEVNTAIVDELDRVKDSPYADGWMVKIEVADTAELGDLLSEKQYAQHVELEEH